MTADSLPPSAASRYVTYALLALVVLASGLLRFYEIDERGIASSDSVLYTNIAAEWSQGNFVYGVSNDVQYYRPTAFLFFALAFRLFGVHDHAIKSMNSLLDVINIVLVFWILFLLSKRDRWVALAGALLYAALPIAVRVARSEYVHTVSCLAVLLSLLFFTVSRQTSNRLRRNVFLFLCGAAVAAAALAHEELAFIGAGYVLFLAVNRLPRLGEPHWLKPAIQEMLLLTVPMIAGGLKLATAYGSRKVLSGYGTNVVDSMAAKGPSVSEQTSLLLFFFEKALRLTWNAIIAHASALSLLLFIVATATLAFWAARRLFKSGWRTKEPLPLELLPALIVVVYFFVYSCFFNFYVTRLFMPLVPCVLMTVVLWQRGLLARVAPRILAPTILASAGILASFHFENYRHLPSYAQLSFYRDWQPVSFSDLAFGDSIRFFRSQTYFKLWPRQIYDELKGKVDDDARLLVTSALLHPLAGRRVFQAPVYFGDNAVYVIDHREPLDELISKYRIRYLLFTPLMTDEERLMERYASRYLYGGRWEHGVEVNPGESYGFAPGELTLEKEGSYLEEYLIARQAKVVAARHRRGGGKKRGFGNLMWAVLDLR